MLHSIYNHFVKFMVTVNVIQAFLSLWGKICEFITTKQQLRVKFSTVFSSRGILKLVDYFAS